MRFRARLVLALGGVSLLPLAALAIGVQREMAQRLTVRESARIAALERLTRESLARESDAVAARLAALRDELAEDDRFRIASARPSGPDRPYVLDWAERAMRLTGLSMLQLQDEQGRIVSSGHFRDEFDRLDPELLAALGSLDGAALVRARAPDGPMLVLARIDTLRLGARRLTLVGGVRVDSAFLSRHTIAPTLVVALDAPSGARVAEPRLTIRADERELTALRTSVGRWFGITFGATAATALVVAGLVAARVARPLAELAEQSARVDLDRLDADFASRRNDEIGELARLLGVMTRRLRASATRLREAERRAAIGDVARQVNHDLRNGLAPIRHVLRHLAEVERDDSSRLGAIFVERRATLDGSVEYLETLARRYARLGGRVEVVSCDVGAIARDVATGFADANGADPAVRIAAQPAIVHADPLALRRILVNLISNAVDATRAGGGTVAVAVEAVAPGVARVSVVDDGPGMSETQLARALEGFHTTKPHGSGLGLAIVRRLTTDIGWSLRIESGPGAGTRVTLRSPDR